MHGFSFYVYERSGTAGLGWLCNDGDELTTDQAQVLAIIELARAVHELAESVSNTEKEAKEV